MHNSAQKNALKIRQLSWQSISTIMKVKIFSDVAAENPQTIENEMNDFLSRTDIEIVTITQSSARLSGVVTVFSIWYREIGLPMGIE